MSNYRKEAELDELLQSKEGVKGLIGELPEDTVSLAWRSALNEKLMTEAKPARQRGWLWKPVAGLALAGALALVTFIPRTPPATTANFESKLVNAHLSLSNAREVAGTGLTAYESMQETKAVDSFHSWTEADLNL